LGVMASAQRVTLALDSVAPARWIGAPLRVTRPLRYSLYQSSDNAWWLGERDWNADAARFNTIQPVAGPFLSPASRGLHFAYFDSAGGELVSPVADASMLALMRIELRGETKNAPRALVVNTSGKRVDSLSMWVLLRNRR